MSHIISQKVSLVIRVFDDYTLKPINNPISIFLNGRLRKPIKKDDGCFIFINLEENRYEVEMKSENYFDEILKINMEELDKLNPVVNIRLKLKPMFFNHKDGTIIKYRLIDENNSLPIANKEVKVILSTRGYYAGRIMNQSIFSLSKTAEIEDFYGELFSGDSLYIESPNEETGEIITIFEKMNKCEYKFINLVRHDHFQGEKLRHAFISKTDSGGNGIIYFRKLLREKNTIRIVFESQFGLKEVNKDIEKDTLINLGNISF